MNQGISKAVDIGQRLATLALVGYTTYILGQSIYRNYHVNQEISRGKQEIVSLEFAAEKQKLLNLYYQSSTYRQLEARRRLNLKLPDEKVFILPEKKELAPAVLSDTTNESQSAKSPDSNPIKWRRLIIGK